MKLKEFFDRAIQIGIDNDPRGRDFVVKELERKREKYEKMTDKEKADFDTSSLENPYADSGILYAEGGEDIASALVGIDIEVGEVLLGWTIRQQGRPMDALIAHHPEGLSYANLYQVMGMQADILNRFGIPINTAESLMEKRIADVERRLLPVNHTRAVDAAKLMGVPMINIHTPADNMVATYLQNMFDSKQPYDLGEVLELLLEVPEYKMAKKNGAGPKIILGSEKRRTGRVFVDMTGGTEGSKDIFGSMAASGINTIVGMHFSDDHRKEAEKHHLNMVIAGHISSDNVGINLLLDKVLEGQQFKVYDCSGFRRVERA